MSYHFYTEMPSVFPVNTSHLLEMGVGIISRIFPQFPQCCSGKCSPKLTASWSKTDSPTVEFLKQGINPVFMKPVSVFRWITETLAFPFSLHWESGLFSILLCSPEREAPGCQSIFLYLNGRSREGLLPRKNEGRLSQWGNTFWEWEERPSQKPENSNKCINFPP